MTATQDGPQPALAQVLQDTIENILLGGPPKYTRRQVEQLSGFSPERAHQLWRSMGFTENAEDVVAYTDADIAELSRVVELQREGLVDDELFLATTRFMGQTFAQLAAWEGQLAIDRVLGALDPTQHPDLQDTLDFTNRVIPLLEQTHSYVWRRQLAAYLARKIGQAQAGDDPTATDLAVGFADISGYTSLTRKLDEMQLHRLLEDFETEATFAVGAHGGRVVKMIGDAVLFAADTVGDAAEIALDLVAAWEHLHEEKDHPQIKVGVAYGPVVSRLGDVFGSTVNIAARLTSIGRPGWIVVDRTMSELLADNEAYRLRPRRPQEVRGFHRLYSWRLERVPAEGASAKERRRKRRSSEP